MVYPPLYIGFKMILENNGYNIIISDLKKDEKRFYRMDYEIWKKIKENKIQSTIFCSPYYPCERVWKKEEKVKALELLEMYNVNFAADEIWSDLILFKNKHIPIQSVNDYTKNHTISFYTVSKTFNLSGLIGSYHIVYNKYLKVNWKGIFFMPL